jgi:2-oxo-3-hexenedioate decarboxylase
MSIDDALVRDLAGRLEDAKAGRRAVAPLSDDAPGLDLATGYAIQRTARAKAGALAGWKLGVTSRAKQKQVGIDSPIYGYLPASDALDVGEPLDVTAHIQPRIEPEIVLLIGSDLDGAHVTSADVLRHTAAVAVGLEVLDSRYAGRGRGQRLFRAFHGRRLGGGARDRPAAGRRGAGTRR